MSTVTRCPSRVERTTRYSRVRPSQCGWETPHWILSSANWIEPITWLSFSQVSGRKSLPADVLAMVSAAERCYTLIWEHPNLSLELLVRSHPLSIHLLSSARTGLLLFYPNLQSTPQVISKSHFLFRGFWTPRAEWPIERLCTWSTLCSWPMLLLIVSTSAAKPWGQAPGRPCLPSHSRYAPEAAQWPVRKPGIQTGFIPMVVNVILS